MTQEEINKVAHEYKVNETKRVLHLIRKPDEFEMDFRLFCAKDLEAAFKAGIELADKYSELKKATSIDRKEEILKAAIDDCQKSNMPYGVCPFVAGAEWADEHPIELEEEVMKARVKDEDLRGWISWSERKPEEGTRGVVIVCDGVGFRFVSMGEIDIKMIESMWKNRTQDMYWSYLPKFKIGGNKVGGIAEKVSASDNYCIFKEPEHKNINWERRRYELAKSAMQGLLNATSVERFTLRIKHPSITKASLEYIDELIKELKKNNKKN